MSTPDGKRRLQRVERELREVVALFLSTNLKDEVTGLVTVSRVEVAKDLKYAKVYVSVYGSKVEGKETLKILQAAAGEVQHQVNKSIRMKFSPKITFILDEKMEQVLKVQKIIHDLNLATGPTESEGLDESED